MPEHTLTQINKNCCYAGKIPGHLTIIYFDYIMKKLIMFAKSYQ